MRWSVGGLAFLIVAMLAWTDRQGWFLFEGDVCRRYGGRWVSVVSMLDLETLLIDVSTDEVMDQLHEVRLLGVRGVDTSALGQTTDAAFDDDARRLFEGQMVRLRLERYHLRHHEGLPLVLAELPDGTLLNERLLAMGLARTDMTVPHRYLRRFSLLENQARHDRVGMWGLDGGEVVGLAP